MQPSVVRRRRVGSLVLAVTLLATGTVLAAWKHNRLAAERSSTQPEPVEAVTVATATPREHRETTTAIGTVLALRSITLGNELAGTVRHVSLTPGAIVEAGTVLVALDISVEAADLRGAPGAGRAGPDHPPPARVPPSSTRPSPRPRSIRRGPQRDVALAQVARLKAVIASKTIRAPFRARVGIADVHPGQYLNEGTQLTTLQGVERGATWTSPSPSASPRLWRMGDDGGDRHRRRWRSRSPRRIVAIDARVDPATRNAMVRARISGGQEPAVARRVGPGPGAGWARRARGRGAGERPPQGSGRRPRLRDLAADKDGKHAPTSARWPAARCWATRC